MATNSGHTSDSDPGSVSIRADDLAQMVDGELVGKADLILRTLSPIEEGGEGSLTFIRSQSFAKLWADSPCQGALVTKGVEIPEHDPEHRALIYVHDADVAVVQILTAISPPTAVPQAGIHPSATIHPDAQIHPSATIGPGCVIAKSATIGPEAVLIANAYIGEDAQIGQGTLLHPGVVVGDGCNIGDRGLIFANSVIGADGFGFLTATEDHPVIKVPHIGTVEIGDDVEIGACSTIDRAKFGITKIGHRTKLDNQVHIGHNCIIGNDVLICGRTTLGGSASIGDRTMVGGAVVLNDQASVGCDVKIAGGSMILNEIADNEAVLGAPAMPVRTGLANIAAQRTIAQFCRRVDKTLKKLDPDYKSS